MLALPTHSFCLRACSIGFDKQRIMLALRSVAAVAITGVAPLIFSSIPGILGFHASLSRRDGGGAVVTRRMYHFDLLSPPRVLSTQHHASVTTGKSSSFSAEDNNSIETPATVPQQQRGSPRHDVRGNDIDADEIDEEEMKVQHNFMEHQKNAPKLGWAVDIRTLVQYNHGFAVMSTNSKSNPGYPGGSVVGFAPDEQGRPIFVFSGMSTHTQDILADAKCSVTVAAKEFKGAADGRVNLMGECYKLAGNEIEAAKSTYLKKHPGAFWINFGDFNWFRLEIKDIRFVGGFARAGSVSVEEFKNAKPDPISEFGPAIAKHMNEDHMGATIAMIAKDIPGMDVSDAVITSVDSLGMYIKVTRTPRASDQPQQFKLRLPFPRPAQDRADVRSIIVEMTQAASVPSSAI